MAYTLGLVQWTVGQFSGAALATCAGLRQHCVAIACAAAGDRQRVYCGSLSSRSGRMVGIVRLALAVAAA